MIESTPITFTEPLVLTVTQLNQQVQQLLTQQVGTIWLSGEISNCSQPASGHCYFTLKDTQAQVRCVLFYQRRRQLTLQPENGIQVLIAAQVTLYAPRGDYQLIVENLQPLGIGLLQQQLARLKQQLSAEGLFQAHHKQPLPRTPQRLGIITSASGAVLQDILQILKRRDPSLPIVIYPAAVQGSAAPAQLVWALQLAEQRQECDVLILARGGGSLEALWSFNEISVARAIFACPIPIISAIGHETDVTIADLVADVRAPTPSAAAELVSRDQQALLQQLSTWQQTMSLAVDYFITRQRTILQNKQQQLHQYHPQRQVLRQQTIVLQLQQRLRQAIANHWQQQRMASQRLQQLLWQRSPLHQQPQQRLQKQCHQLQHAWHQHYQALQQQFSILCAKLQSASPLAILARGFSLTLDPQGKPLRFLEQISMGETLETRITNGWVTSTITHITQQVDLS